jgi:hypothetical protein
VTSVTFVWSGLELKVLLPLPLRSLNYKHAPPHLALFLCFDTSSVLLYLTVSPILQGQWIMLTYIYKKLEKDKEHYQALTIRKWQEHGFGCRSVRHIAHVSPLWLPPVCICLKRGMIAYLQSYIYRALSTNWSITICKALIFVKQIGVPTM